MLQLLKRKDSLEVLVRDNERKLSNVEKNINAMIDPSKLKKLEDTYQQYLALAAQCKIQYENAEAQLKVVKEKYENGQQAV